MNSSIVLVVGALRYWDRWQPGEREQALACFPSLAFTGPILKLVSGPKGGGFQFWGPKETGKSTTAMVAGSVWGCHTAAGTPEIGFAEAWNSTVGEIERTALAHNDVIFILDETLLAGSTDPQRAQVVVAVIVTLAQQREKARMTNTGSPRSWRCYFLSTSNFSLDVLAKLGSIVLNDAYRSRLTEIPLPVNGVAIYEDLHGFESGELLTEVLDKRCRRYYGSAGLEFQKRLVTDYQQDASSLKKWLARRRKAYRKSLKSEAKTAGVTPMNRSTNRCATVYAAGCLAAKYEILPWTKKELLQAILSCQLNGLTGGSAQPIDPDNSGTDLRAKLVSYLQEHRKEFTDLDKGKPKLGTQKFGSVPGYVATFKGKKWFYLTSKRLRKLIGSGGDARPARSRRFRSK